MRRCRRRGGGDDDVGRNKPRKEWINLLEATVARASADAIRTGVDAGTGAKVDYGEGIDAISPVSGPTSGPTVSCCAVRFRG